MKSNKIYKGLFLSGCLAVMSMTTSCEDFLTIHPSGQITEEEFWEDKTDLQSVLAGCYKQFCDVDMVTRYVVWGEGRSDNFDLKKEGWTDMKDIINANLEDKNSLFKWGAYYKAINYCNKVLAFGPEVVKRDPSFSESDWLPIKAEATALRSLAYFYLVRAYRDVPYVTISVNTDEEAMAQRVRQTASQEVLTSLIEDLEEVKDDAMTNYGNSVYNKGRITKNAVYTLLADIYLWRAAKNAPADSVAKYPDEAGLYASQSAADYHKVIEYSDYVINKIIEDNRNNGNWTGGIGGSSGSTFPLIPIYLGSSDMFSSTKYNSIFGTKNSTESIFELQFDGSKNKNSALNSYSDYTGLYGQPSASGTGGTVSTGYFQGSSIVQAADASQDPKDHVYSKTDTRQWESICYMSASQKEFPILKYLAQSVSLQQSTKNKGEIESALYVVRMGDLDANWIFYRVSDAMLMKAEAISQLYPNDASNLEEGFILANAVYERSNPGIKDEQKLKFADYNTGEKLYDFVMRERQREFFAEGKRWFDLVRMAHTKGSPKTILDLLVKKYSSNQAAIKAKLSSMDALYSPVHRDEIKVNPNLVQNPAWKKNDASERN